MNEEMNMYEEEIITLLDENDNEIKFLPIMTFEGEDKIYMALRPAEEVENFEEDEVVIMEAKFVDDDGEEFMLIDIQTEEELNAAFALFEECYYEECDGNCAECDEEDCEDRE